MCNLNTGGVFVRTVSVFTKGRVRVKNDCSISEGRVGNTDLMASLWTTLRTTPWTMLWTTQWTALWTTQLLLG